MKKLESWLSITEDSDFSIYNLPFGIFSTKEKTARVGVAIGDQIIDVSEVAKLKHFKKLDIPMECLLNNSLNDFIALGKRKTNGVRKILQELLLKGSRKIRNKDGVFVAQKMLKCTCQLRLRITLIFIRV